jgi:hypothetical protein
MARRKHHQRIMKKRPGMFFLAFLDAFLQVTLSIAFLISVWGQMEKYFAGQTITTSEFVKLTDKNFQLPRYGKARVRRAISTPNITIKRYCIFLIIF